MPDIIRFHVKSVTRRSPYLLNALDRAQDDCKTGYAKEWKAADDYAKKQAAGSSEPFYDPDTNEETVPRTPAEIEHALEELTQRLTLLQQGLRDTKTVEDQKDALVGILHDTLLDVLFHGTDHKVLHSLIEIVKRTAQYNVDAMDAEENAIKAAGGALDKAQFKQFFDYEVFCGNIPCDFADMVEEADHALRLMARAYQADKGVPEAECIPTVYGLAMQEARRKMSIRDLNRNADASAIADKGAVYEMLNTLFAPYAEALPEDPCPEMAVFIMHAIGDAAQRKSIAPIHFQQAAKGSFPQFKRPTPIDAAPDPSRKDDIPPTNSAFKSDTVVAARRFAESVYDPEMAAKACRILEEFRGYCETYKNCSEDLVLLMRTFSEWRARDTSAP